MRYTQDIAYGAAKTYDLGKAGMPFAYGAPLSYNASLSYLAIDWGLPLEIADALSLQESSCFHLALVRQENMHMTFGRIWYINGQEDNWARNEEVLPNWASTQGSLGSSWQAHGQNSTSWETIASPTSLWSAKPESKPDWREKTD